MTVGGMGFIPERLLMMMMISNQLSLCDWVVLGMGCWARHAGAPERTWLPA